MTYQAIVNILRAADVVVTGANAFFHGNRKAMSLQFDKPFPQTHLYPIRTRKDKDDNMFHSISIIFWEQDRLESSLTETETIMQTSQTRLLAFEAYLRANHPTLSISDINMTNEEKTIMATASGYAAQFTIISKLGC